VAPSEQFDLAGMEIVVRPHNSDETPRRAVLEVPVLRGIPAGAPAAGPGALRRAPGRPGPSRRRALAPEAAGALGGAVVDDLELIGNGLGVVKATGG